MFDDDHQPFRLVFFGQMKQKFNRLSLKNKGKNVRRLIKQKHHPRCEAWGWENHVTGMFCTAKPRWSHHEPGGLCSEKKCKRYWLKIKMY